MIPPPAIPPIAGASSTPSPSGATGLDAPAALAVDNVDKLSRTRTFAKAFGTRALWTLSLQVGTPVIAVTAPALIEALHGDAKNNVPANLVVGSVMGGVWGALVGAAIPINHANVRVPRIKAMGMGAGAGLVMGASVAGATRLVINWFIDPENPGRTAAPGTPR